MFARKGKMAFRSPNVVDEREYKVISKIAFKAVLKEDFADRALIDSLVTSEAVDQYNATITSEDLNNA